MGGGTYTTASYRALSNSKGYDHKDRSQIFESHGLNSEMDPKTAVIRESRDSEEHPNTLAIAIGLDVTGSMGFVPEQIVKNGLPTLMDAIMQAGIEHPQVLFMGIGDHVYDRAPLQIGQFESSAELLDKWLTKVYLESGGGGNNWESYTLAWLMAARHTDIDCFKKRGQKGFLFTIGDEPINPEIPGDIIDRLTSEGQAKTISSKDLYEEVSKTYNVFHIHVVHGRGSAETDRYESWKEILGQNLIILDDYNQLSKKIAELIITKTNTATSPSVTTDSTATPTAPMEEML